MLITDFPNEFIVAISQYLYQHQLDIPKDDEYHEDDFEGDEDEDDYEELD